MRLKHRELGRALEYVTERAQILRVECESLCIRANTDMDDGISGVSYDKKGRSSGPSDPVGSRAEKNRVDQVAVSAKVFRQAVADAVRVIQRAEKAAWSLRALDPDEARALTDHDELSNTKDQTIQAQCQNPHCRRLVARTPNDRLRGGRCDACRKYLDRHGIERTRDLCAISENAGTALALDENVIVEEVA